MIAWHDRGGGRWETGDLSFRKECCRFKVGGKYVISKSKMTDDELEERRRYRERRDEWRRKLNNEKCEACQAEEAAADASRDCFRIDFHESKDGGNIRIGAAAYTLGWARVQVEGHYFDLCKVTTAEFDAVKERERRADQPEHRRFAKIAKQTWIAEGGAARWAAKNLRLSGAAKAQFEAFEKAEREAAPKVSITEAAKAVQSVLERAFPESKISVTCPGQICVTWTNDGPTLRQVKDALVKAGCATVARNWTNTPCLKAGEHSFWLDRKNKERVPS